IWEACELLPFHFWTVNPSVLGQLTSSSSGHWRTSLTQWNHVFGDPILTEAVIDRLIHHSHLVVFNGESHRYKE
ncbi:ATP-binding protein, partial [Cytobacillus firmus]|uniref:ATP-binding protein n=1 Tax=Cytobacillus firmus TaxID=1399 RepID=UPI003BA23104